ncbi:NAD(P)/FAD-dependent oxidoreductase [Falsiroseomonas tokyonensis]|uniref:NAD(P)/FAD-dependent oxidoreductase n=1 Tax=Falsiroseomonas tokyonensis TaxID=430521 RepID=A0ABV7C0E6_9PROT|nr:FAD-dependent monooxygenase [Falsiroseomonas tokyonensis]MBU8540950.1 FAD-dependent monooxygenase [Falsiroseomonas tokyonensis]
MTGRSLILGGGPAGAAAAITLARAGAAPLLVERAAAPAEKVCGEFLGADAAALLAGLGLDLAALGAVPIRSAQFGAGRHRSRMPLPFAAWSLPRLTLDAALLARAEEAGAELHCGAAALVAEAGPRGWRLRLADGATPEGAQLVLATGKHEMRGLARPAAGGSLGVKLALHGVEMGEAIALLACPGGYAGLQPRAGGGANLCLALAPGTPGLAQAARDPAALLAHVAAASDLAAELLRAARPAWPRPLTVAGVPYGYLHRAAGGPGGLFRVGDQAAVVPSLCGDGIAMALASGQRAAEAIRAGAGAEAFHAAWASSVRPGMRLAGLADGLMARTPQALVRLAGAWPGLAGWAARGTRMGLA